ncbi:MULTISPECIES: hypothetical protein [Aeromonas]|uniref:hypothetical protein n=1 Tax=Aeromonas TaxID=642 RepID=UPI0011CAD339|nr:hypothetical protein [Aeromonas veronii]
MKSKVTCILLVLSISIYLVSIRLVERAEYKNLISFSSAPKTEDSFAEIYKFRESSNWHEVWHVIINELNFASTLYLTGSSIKGTAKFKSHGHYEINSHDGEVYIIYKTIQDGEGNEVSDLSRIRAYLTQVGRDGMENKNSIKVIYNDSHMKIIKREQSDEFILYSHTSSE